MRKLIGVTVVAVLTSLPAMAQAGEENAKPAGEQEPGISKPELTEPEQAEAALAGPVLPEAGSNELELADGAEHPGADHLIPRGTRVPLVLLNSISTKHASPGDLVYLESVFPVIVEGRILIPPGTYVSGSVTSVKRTGRVKGRGELYLRFDQMILPNGTIRDLTGRVGSMDGRSPEDFDREEGQIKAEGSKGEDGRSVGETTAAGASIGAIAGAAGGRTGMGLGIGAAAGVAAGLIGVLTSRGPEAILEKGTQLDMVLDRDLEFTETEVTFQDPLRGPMRDAGPGPDPNRNHRQRGYGRFPL
jgi:type IV secretion system protein VirB10